MSVAEAETTHGLPLTEDHIRFLANGIAQPAEPVGDERRAHLTLITPEDETTEATEDPVEPVNPLLDQLKSYWGVKGDRRLMNSQIVQNEILPGRLVVVAAMMGTGYYNHHHDYRPMPITREGEVVACNALGISDYHWDKAKRASRQALSLCIADIWPLKADPFLADAFAEAPPLGHKDIKDLLQEANRVSRDEVNEEMLGRWAKKALAAVDVSGEEPAPSGGKFSIWYD